MVVLLSRSNPVLLRCCAYCGRFMDSAGKPHLRMVLAWFLNFLISLTAGTVALSHGLCSVCLEGERQALEARKLAKLLTPVVSSAGPGRVASVDERRSDDFSVV